MIFIKSEQEILLIREGAEILSGVHGQIARAVRPGVTTKQLDALAESFIRDNGGVPSFKGYKKFPATLCTSVNEYVVHGLPSGYVLRDGDVISVDCGVYYQGFHSDAAFTYPVGNVSEPIMRLLRRTKEALYLGIEKAQADKRVGDVGYAIQHHAESHGYAVVRELVGHGVGRGLHEDPQVPNYGIEGCGVQLQQGMVLAIEPIVSLGRARVLCDKRGQFRTIDRSIAAHFEHTVVVSKRGAEVLTTYRYIEEVFKF